MEKLKSILKTNCGKVFVLGAGLITLPVFFEISNGAKVDPELWVVVANLLGFALAGSGIFYCYKRLSDY